MISSSRIKNMSLKWKISLVISVIVVMAMVAVSLITYNYTSNIVMEQVESKVNIIKDNLKNNIADLVTRISTQVNNLSMIEDYYYFAYMSKYYLKEKDNGLVDEAWVHVINERINNLKNDQKLIGLVDFVYITDLDGVIIADSRINEDAKLADYIGNKYINEDYQELSTNKIYFINGEPFLLFSSPISNPDTGIISGNYVAAISSQIFGKYLANDSLGGEIRLINEDGIVIYDNDDSQIGKKIDDEFIINVISNNQDSARTQTENSFLIAEKLSEDMGTYIYFQIPAAVIQEPVVNLGNIILLIAIFAVLTVFIVAYVFVFWQLNPLPKLSNAYQALSEGKLVEDSSLNRIKRRDEIGALTNGFNKMLNELRTIILNIKETAAAVENSSLQLNNISEEVSKVSEQVTYSIQEVAVGTEKQAERLAFMEDAAKKFADGINNLKKNNDQVVVKTDKMKHMTEDGIVHIDRVKEQMDNIDKSIAEVGTGINKLNEIFVEINDILELLNNIANQTNLLALNAAIEAARAGENGRGFSVVAEEIRQLAQESIESSERISQLINNIKKELENATNKMKAGSSNVKEGVEIVNYTKTYFDDIKSSILDVVSAINDNSNDVQDINERIDEIVQSIIEIASISEESSANSQEVAASSQEQASSIKEITDHVGKLKAMSGKLNSLIEKFQV